MAQTVIAQQPRAGSRSYASEVSWLNTLNIYMPSHLGFGKFPPSLKLRRTGRAGRAGRLVNYAGQGFRALLLLGVREEGSAL